MEEAVLLKIALFASRKALGQRPIISHFAIVVVISLRVVSVFFSCSKLNHRLFTLPHTPLFTDLLYTHTAHDHRSKVE